MYSNSDPRRDRFRKPQAEHLESRVLLAAQFVADLNPTDEGSGVQWFTSVNGATLFWANPAGSPIGVNQTNGAVYRTDGTSAGTSVVRSGLSGNSTPPVIIGNVAYFEVLQNSGLNNTAALWRTDGTSAGTQQVMPLPASAQLSVCNGELYFALGSDLWKSDGTAAGTQLVHHFASYAGPTDMTYYNGAVYFGVAGSSGSGLWKTDGTDAGTVPVKTTDANTNAAPHGLRVANGLLYFAGYTAATNFEPWRSDGTAAGTFMLKDLSSGFTSSFPRDFVAGPNQTVFFVANGGLCQTDGTSLHTTGPLFTSSGESVYGIGELKTLGSELFFGGETINSGWRLWKFGNPSSGIVSVSSSGLGGVPTDLEPIQTASGPRLFFTAQDGPGNDRWISDGTPGGTQNFTNGVQGSEYQVLGNRVYFLGADSTYGQEPYVSDGTAAGTHLVENLNSTPNSSSPRTAVSFGGNYYAVADSPSGTSWWRSDGSTAIPIPTPADAIPSSAYTAPQVVPFGNAAYYFGSGGNGFYRLDAAGSTELNSQVRLAASPISFMPFNGQLYFLPILGNSPQLYKTDGTAAGTVAASTLLDSTGGLAAGGGLLYYSGVPVGANSPTLWRSDGTTAGTTPILNWHANWGTGSFYNLVWFNGFLYFMWTDRGPTSFFTDIYRTDGTSPPTLVADFQSPGILQPPAPVVAGSNLIFVIPRPDFVPGEAGVNQTELWVVPSNGRSAGVASNITPTNSASNFQMLTAIGDRAFFLADDGSGRSLWVTDGTAGGTFRLTPNLDWPSGLGPNWLPPGSVATVGGQLFFDAGDTSKGKELWRSDGTVAGTAPIADLNPGIASSDPGAMAAVGSTLLFAASDPVHGRELWKLPDTFAPEVWGATGSPNSLTFTFNEDVSATLSPADLVVRDLSTGQTVPSNRFSLTYDRSTNSARFIFSGAPISDGQYQATLLGSGIMDQAGNPLAGAGSAATDYNFAFWSLLGDVNGDRSVNFADLLTLAQSYGRTNSTYSDGDLNFDGTVGFADLLLLAQRYGTSLAGVSASALTASVHPARPLRKSR